MSEEITTTETTTEEITDTSTESTESSSTEKSQEDIDYENWLNSSDEEDMSIPDEESDSEDKQESESKKDKDKDSDKEESKSKEEEKPAEKWKLKVNGEEIEYDPSDVVKTQQLVQRGLSATQTWQEAAKVRQQANQLVSTLRENPRAILENPNLLGRDKLIELSEQLLMEEYELEGLPESEREYKMKLRQIEADKLKQAKLQQEQIRKQQIERQKQVQTALNKEVAKSLSDSKVPSIYLDATINVMKEIHRAGGKPTVEEAVSYVKDHYVQEQQNYLKSLSEEELINLIGADNFDRLREFNVKKTSSKPVSKPITKSSSSSSSSNKTPKYRNEAQFLKEMSKKPFNW